MRDDILQDAINRLLAEGWDNEAQAIADAVAEIKRLREASRESRQIQEDEIKRLGKDLAGLRKIAIDERSKNKHPNYNELPEEDWEEKRDCGKDDFYLLRNRGKRTLRNEAAQELQLEAAKGAGYVERLQEAFIIADANLLARQRFGEDWHNESCIKAAYEEARADLAKIREGKT
jgi:hypothetical protein